jgi:protein SCO1/2
MPGRVIPSGAPQARSPRTRLLGVTFLIATLAACGARGTSAPDFTLMGDDGRPWTLSAQRGRPVLLTFGFTHCIDTCPATLAKLSHLTRTLGTSADNVEIAMVTVDPQRDTPALLHRFVAHFDRPIVGLTGNSAEVRAVEAAYHVWAQSIPGKHRSPKSYDVAHTAVIYAIDARGRIRDVRNDDDSEAALATTVRELAN